MTFYLRTLNGDKHTVGKTLPPIECFRCGLCCQCYQPQLSPDAAAAMARGLGISTTDFIARYVQMTTIGYLLRQTARGCVFLTWKQQRANCRIYAFRPDACRNWVASLSRRECREGLARLKAAGKIMLAKELYSSPEPADKFYSSLTGQ